MTFDELYGVIYFIKGFVRIPYLNINLPNEKYIKNNKWNYDKLRSDVMKIYNENKDKLK